MDGSCGSVEGHPVILDSFTVTIEGQLIRVSLNKKDEKLSGEALYSGEKTDITTEKVM